MWSCRQTVAALVRMDNFESEVVGGACGAPDRGGISKNGSNK